MPARRERRRPIGAVRQLPTRSERREVARSRRADDADVVAIVVMRYRSETAASTVCQGVLGVIIIRQASQLPVISAVETTRDLTAFE